MQEGDRIAQLIIEKIYTPDVLEVEVGPGLSIVVLMLIVWKEPRRDSSWNQRFWVNRWTRSTDGLVIESDNQACKYMIYCPSCNAERCYVLHPRTSVLIRDWHSKDYLQVEETHHNCVISLDQFPLHTCPLAYDLRSEVVRSPVFHRRAAPLSEGSQQSLPRRAHLGWNYPTDGLH